MNWETIHHLADLTGIVTIAGGYILHRLAKWRTYQGWIEGDHKKVTAMWREHGYGEWDGVERRRENR